MVVFQVVNQANKKEEKSIEVKYLEYIRLRKAKGFPTLIANGLTTQGHEYIVMD